LSATRAREEIKRLTRAAKNFNDFSAEEFHREGSYRGLPKVTDASTAS